MSDLDKEMKKLRNEGGQNAVDAYHQLREAILSDTGSKIDLVTRISELMELYGTLSVASAVKLLARQKSDLVHIIEESCYDKKNT